MMQPKRTKYNKQQKGRRLSRGYAWCCNKVVFGDFGIQATTHGRITARQIEAARKAINRYIKRGGKLWIRKMTDVPVTKKPLEVRMGSGKGNVEYWVAIVKPGSMLFELAGVTKEVAAEALRLAGAKLPVQVRFLERVVR